MAAASARTIFRNVISLNLLPRSGCGCSNILHSKGIATKPQLSNLTKLNLAENVWPIQNSMQTCWFVFKRFLASSRRSSKKINIASKNEALKPELKLGPAVMYHELPIIFVNATYNNTMFTITDHNGKYAGALGFKGAKRGTNHAAQTAGEAAAKKASSLGIGRVRVKIRGMGPGRQTSIKGLLAGGSEIVSITDVTPIPHNGCRPPKQRRI
eukprot:gene9819-10827_t